MLRTMGSSLQKTSDHPATGEPRNVATCSAKSAVAIRAVKGTEPGNRYKQAALTVANTLFDQPYLSTQPQHQGLILHSVYHRPRGWDHIPHGRHAPCGESSMWGDYHARELALLLLREAKRQPYLTFFNVPNE